MRKHKELSDPNSCLNRARIDEPIFVLLGRDVAAVNTVRFWIEERIRWGKNQRSDAQIIEAQQWIKNVQGENPNDQAPASSQ